MKILRYTLSIVFYIIGDLISRTIMMYGNGYGYSIYKICMLWSCNLDKEGNIWKYPKQTKTRINTDDQNFL